MNKVVLVKRMLCVTSVLLSAGCANIEPNTLGTLRYFPSLKVDKTAAITSAREKTIKNYWGFIKSAPQDTQRVEAQRQAADLKLADAELDTPTKMDVANDNVQDDLRAMDINPSSPFYEKALSQRGWVAFRRKQYDKSLEFFLGLVDHRLLGETGVISNDFSALSAEEQKLFTNIFRIVLLSFNKLGGAQAIGSYFDKHGHRAYEERVYKDLADFYLKQGRIRDSVDVDKAFVAWHPNHDSAPDFDMRAINALGKGGFTELMTKAMLEFVRTYRVKGDYWNRHNEKVRASLLSLLSKNLEEVARHFHAEAQKTKSPKDYQQANFWYRTYIKTFPKTVKSAEMNFLLAESLFELKQYQMAAREYEITAYQYVKKGKNPEAGYAALLAYGKLEKQAKGRQKEIWDRLTIGSALRFGKAFPNDPRASAVVTKAAEDLFALKKYDQASVAARSILELNSDTTLEMRRTAWMIVAKAELHNAKYARAEAAYKIALSMAKNDKAIRKIINDGLAATVFKRAEQLRAVGDMKGAVAQFSRVSQVAPTSSITLTAELELASNYLLQKKWTQAIVQLLLFRQKHPGHLQKQVSENLVTAYLKLKRPLNAAAEMKNLMALEQDSDKKRDMLWQIAQLYSQGGDVEKEKDTYQRYITQYPTPIAQSIEAQETLADIYHTQGDNRQYFYWLKQVIESDSKAANARTDRTRYLAANATFILAKPELEQYNKVRLVAPLKANLKIKKQRMQEAVNALTAAANYGVEEVTTASVYWLAEIYKSFSKELIQSERPQGLSAEERQQYDILLEEQAYPFEEKSIDIYESNVKRVRDGTYDKWVKKSFAALETLDPARYRKEEKSEQVFNGML